jgi:23S rRNA pseudouridine1911/1915/1917 synthase
MRFPPAEPGADWLSTIMLNVLYEDNHLLAVDKPAMLPTMGVAEDRPSLIAVAREYIRDKYDKPGNVYLGVVSRLDAPVTGVVLIARTSKAAARLTRQFRDREVEKIYWALVEGAVDPPAARLSDYVRKDERHRRMHIASSSTPDAQAAELTYRVLATWPESLQSNDESATTLLEVQLLTGRKHQIRLQLAHALWPIVGDRKYGSRRSFPRGIALCARRLTLVHPVRRVPITIEAPLPATWPSWTRHQC